MYTAPLLAKLLAQQSAQRTPDLFKQGTFKLNWRAKVGSFPAPDTETLISAGEPDGEWKWTPQDFGDLGERPKTLPLRCFIPASSIRGIVRAWAIQRESLRERLFTLLGNQNNDGNITPGKIDFLDAWPVEATSPSLDVVTPQEKFQVFHDLKEKSQPHALYTFGDGEVPIEVVVAIRGVPGKTTPEEVDEVWQWVQQALRSHGVGSRTSAGYGGITAPSEFSPSPEIRKRLPDQRAQKFEFELYSQGSYGADSNTPELRPTHWRGWLRSWLLRFLLGTMSEANAQKTLAEIMGGLGSEGERGVKGDIRLSLQPGSDSWGKRSSGDHRFYCWKGHIILSGSAENLNAIVLPVLAFAATLGGLGRGWRRPLHYYQRLPISRGTQLVLRRIIPKQNPRRWFISIDQDWSIFYEQWRQSVQTRWPERMQAVQSIQAEIFSPSTCAVYALPGPVQEPVNFLDLLWAEEDAGYTRGDGLSLIYDPKYKRKQAVGGDAANGDSHCSWVSISRLQQKHFQAGTDCQEIVCLFMGKPDRLRQKFLEDLHNIPGSTHLFGMSV